jgi:hypothetical protein
MSTNLTFEATNAARRSRKSGKRSIVSQPPGFFVELASSAYSFNGIDGQPELEISLVELLV